MGRRRNPLHIDSLDGLRGICALIVLTTHTYRAVALDPELLAAIRKTPLVIGLNGLGAVHIFFILSGYCLASSAGRSLDLSSLTQFYTRRVFRIHPPYLAALLAAWTASFYYDLSGTGGGVSRWLIELSEIHLSPRELASHLWFPDKAADQLPVAWTLAVEMIFSLLLPVMVLLARRTHWIVLVAISAYPGLAAAYAFSYLQYALHFSLGIALYEERAWLRDRLTSLGRVSGAIFVSIGLALFCVAPTQDVLFSAVGRGSSALAGTLLVSAALFIAPVSRVLSHGVVRFLGRISYSSYLVHFTILILVAGFVTGPVTLAQGLLVFAATFSLTTLFGTIGYRAVELPSIALGNRAVRRLASWLGSEARVSRLAE